MVFFASCKREYYNVSILGVTKVCSPLTSLGHVDKFYCRSLPKWGFLLGGGSIKKVHHKKKTNVLAGGAAPPPPPPQETQLINISHMMQKENKKKHIGKNKNSKIPTTTHYFVVGQSKRLIAKANF